MRAVAFNDTKFRWACAFSERPMAELGTGVR
jgi:hypothetical protein